MQQDATFITRIQDSWRAHTTNFHQAYEKEDWDLIASKVHRGHDINEVTCSWLKNPGGFSSNILYRAISGKRHDHVERLLRLGASADAVCYKDERDREFSPFYFLTNQCVHYQHAPCDPKRCNSCATFCVLYALGSYVSQRMDIPVIYKNSVAWQCYDQEYDQEVKKLQEPLKDLEPHIPKDVVQQVIIPYLAPPMPTCIRYRWVDRPTRYEGICNKQYSYQRSDDQGTTWSEPKWFIYYENPDPKKEY